jgi:hypothetical protein
VLSRLGSRIFGLLLGTRLISAYPIPVVLPGGGKVLANLCAPLAEKLVGKGPAIRATVWRIAIHRMLAPVCIVAFLLVHWRYIAGSVPRVRRLGNTYFYTVMEGRPVN